MTNYQLPYDKLVLTDKQKQLCASVDSRTKNAELAALNFHENFGDEDSFHMARTNQVETILAHRLMAAEGGELLPAHWKIVHSENHRRLSSYLSELDMIAADFQQVGIPLVALKNGGIARGIYPCWGCCPMGDLDTLIERRHFRQAHEILIKRGFTFKFRSSLEEESLEHAERSGGAEYWKTLSNGEKFWLELQWRPVAGRWIRSDQEPSTEELISQSVSIPGTAVRMLAPEDNLLQVCLHTAKHSYVRAPGFRLHLDVDRIVCFCNESIDWDIFLQRVIRLQVKTPVYFSLAIPKILFDTPIPDRVLAALQPPSWKENLIILWLSHAGVFNPDQSKFSRLGYILFNILLYDDLSGFGRSLFPEKNWMYQHYGVNSSFLLPYYYVRRWIDLAFRRLKT